ncbi:MAG: S49 family peptidase [Saprospiraceae bacterium]|nr:S49 family peptidase [Saprospiraceae bacterium]MBK7467227.1 S49 family peptidase [Saprospiraceae bacterium]
MAQFFKFLFASCLGTLLALLLLFFITIGIATSLASKSMGAETIVSVTDNSVLRINIPAQLPEQTNNVAMDNFSFRDEKVLGIHDYAIAIKKAAEDPKIKGIYIGANQGNHGYASLKVIRDALLEFRKSGKFIISYSNYFDHNSYYIASTANEIYLHPLGMTDLRGFDVSIPFFKELMEKIGLNFNIYYAGEFKSATEPYRLDKISPENKLQLKEYLNGQYSEYVNQVAQSRNIESNSLKTIFDGFIASNPMKAFDTKLIDSIAYEIDALNNMRFKMNLDLNQKINFITPQEYYKADFKNQDYNANNRIAVIFAEGTIIDGKGEEGQIGKNILNY